MEIDILKMESEKYMKKGNTYTGIVERVDFPNKGIVIVDTQQEDGTVKKNSAL